VSYTNLHQFYKVFHRSCAMSPGEYRRYYTPAGSQAETVAAPRAHPAPTNAGPAGLRSEAREAGRAAREEIGVEGWLSRSAMAVHDDWVEAGRICYEAFATLADEHGFPHDFPRCRPHRTRSAG